jgi:hypothetical protein
MAKVLRMEVFLLSLAFAAMAFYFGVILATIISIIPISILARAEQAGRDVRLGACGPLLPRTRSSARRSQWRMGAVGYGLSPAGAGPR